MTATAEWIHATVRPSAARVRKAVVVVVVLDSDRSDKLKWALQIKNH